MKMNTTDRIPLYQKIQDYIRTLIESKGLKEGDRIPTEKELRIPTVVDRVIQQAIAQVLTPIYEKQFSENSFGFRPKRSAHDAIRKSQNNIEQGYKYVVDMDLEKYFDTVIKVNWSKYYREQSRMDESYRSSTST